MNGSRALYHSPSPMYQSTNSVPALLCKGEAYHLACCSGIQPTLLTELMGVLIAEYSKKQAYTKRKLEELSVSELRHALGDDLAGIDGSRECHIQQLKQAEIAGRGVGGSERRAGIGANI